MKFSGVPDTEAFTGQIYAISNQLIPWEIT